MSKGVNMKASDNWIERAGRLERGDWLTIHPRGPLTLDVVRQALEAQHGKKIYAWAHGSAIHMEKR